MQGYCSIGSSESKNLAHKTNAHRSPKRAAKEKAEPPCEICGTFSTQYQDRLLTCKCGAREHIYCMRFPLSKVPKLWVCGDCNPVKSMQPRFQSLTSPRSNCSEGIKKVKYLRLEEVIQRDRSASSARFHSFSASPKMKFHSEKTQKGCRKSKNFVLKSPIKVKNTLSPLGIAKSAQYGQGVSKILPRSNQSSVEARKGISGRQQMELDTVEASIETSLPRVEPGNTVRKAKGDSHVKNSIPKSTIEVKTPISPLGSPHSNQASKVPKKGNLAKSVDGSSVLNESNPMEQPLIRINETDLSYIDRKHPLPKMLQKNLLIQNPPLRNASSFLSNSASLCKFIFSDPAVSEDCNCQFVAYLPRKLGKVSYEHSGFLFSDLAVELIPLSQLSLDFDNWDLLDIGLYIFPDDSARSAQDYCHLLQLMITRDLVIKSPIYDGLDLLIFTSVKLSVDAHCKISASANSGTKRRSFMWGIFYYTKTGSAPSPSLPRPSSPPPPSQWSCPRRDWVKLNTTSTSTPTHSFAVGSVHNSQGEWVFGYILKLCKADQLRAELWALFQGLLLLRGRGFRRVEVESDFDLILQSLSGAVIESDPNKDLINGCRDLLLRDWDITRKIVSKEQNFPVAWLASNFGGVQEEKLEILEKAPVGLFECMKAMQMEENMEWHHT